MNQNPQNPCVFSTFMIFLIGKYNVKKNNTVLQEPHVIWRIKLYEPIQSLSITVAFSLAERLRER